MTTRTFLQQGQGYGTNPVTVTAKVGDAVIYSGPVPTLDQPPPSGGSGQGLGPTINLFSWTNDVDFSGQQSFELTVDGGLLLLTQTVANYTDTTEGTGNAAVFTPGSANIYATFWTETIGNVEIGDPFTNEQIDGVPQIEHPDPEQLSGQWWWYIPNGSTFTATLNVAAGNVG